MWHYVNYTSSLAQAEESSADCFADMFQCAPSSWKNTLGKSCSNDNVTESFHGSPSGTMCAPSTEETGKEKSTSCVAVSPAKTYHAEEREQASQEIVQGFGLKWPELYLRYDRSTCSWKIHPCLFQEEWSESSPTLPNWGIMLNGELSAQTPSIEIINDIECGSMPTPTAAGGHGGRRWDETGGSGARAMLLKCDMSTEDIKQRRNPAYLEWQMGWPIRWTDVNQLETDKIQQWLHSHGKSYQEGN